MSSEPVVGIKRTADEAKLDDPVQLKRHKRNDNYYEIFGDDAKVEIEIRRDELTKRRQRFLHSQDFHTLILWMLGEVVSPNWLFIKHRPLIEKVIVVQINNLNETMIKSLKQYHKNKEGEKVKMDGSITRSNTNNNANNSNNASSTNVNSSHIKSFPYFNKNNYCPLQLDIPKFDKSTKHPSFKKLTVVAIDRIKGLSSNKGGRGGKKKRKKNKINHNNSLNLITSSFGNKYKYCPEMFISSEDELKKNRFPTLKDHQNRYKDFYQLPPSKNIINTQIRTDIDNEDEDEDEDEDISSSDSSSDSVTSSSSDSTVPDTQKRNIEKLVGLDCEMVCTKKGIELARISIVSELGECIYDELVKPSTEVTNYCTKYSGITASMLENVTKTLNDVHTDLSLFMDNKTIICGHGLENDLLALEMIHLNCIDTAIQYPASSSNFKNKLRFLASKFLKRSIQQSHDGHNSHEDALAALDLVKLKV